MFSKIERGTRAALAQERGQALVEYALVIMFVALLAVGALEIIGTSVSQFIFDAAAGVGGG